DIPHRLVIHETLDATTIHENTFRVFPVSDTTETSIAGTRVLNDKDILTFTPMSPLAPQTTYRVVVEGITDIVGNPMERYSFDFTTAGPGSLFYPAITQAGITTDELIVDTPIQFFLNATPDGGQSPDTLEYSWILGTVRSRIGALRAKPSVTPIDLPVSTRSGHACAAATRPTGSRCVISSHRCSSNLRGKTALSPASRRKMEF
ncbi:MAG: Ig-like domain-containing protein, partial [Candidatus Competibacteraceae bacterium]|nr:Ig-like domain-containing protein [Candidatus Competibacteraceae bacterium]